MGSTCSKNSQSKNSKTNSDFFGKFEYESACNCKAKYKIIFSVENRSVKLMIGILPKMIEVLARIDPVHSFVNAQYYCQKCNHFGNLIFDYCNLGIRTRFGKFNNPIKNNKNNTVYDIAITLEEIEIIFQNMIKNGFSKKNYNALKNNCQHFAPLLITKIWRKYLNSYKSK